MSGQVWFDQIYKILESLRSMYRDNYDTQNGRETGERIFFKVARNRAVRCEEDDEGAVPVTICWDYNNAQLRQAAREVLHNL